MNVTKSLFGGDIPWSTRDWISSDDRVRGGSSQSYLNVNRSNTSATFTGTLDTTTLGGAGFASQRTTTNNTFDLSSYTGLLLKVSKSDGKKYTFTLKDEVLPLRSDGREQSTVSWEYDFAIPPFTAGDVKEIYMGWEDFRPTYRGRDVKDAQPLKKESVKRLSFMMRSFFAQQHGHFELVVGEVAAVHREGEMDSTRSSYESSIDEKDARHVKRHTQGWMGWALGGCGML